MGDSIKFGPEWLRNMSNDTGGLSSAATSSTGGGGGVGGATNNFAYPNNQTRYPLAEYRYGREEMLSLYDKNFKLPELLPKFNKLFIEKMQSPLALLPPTADDDTSRGLTPIGGASSERSGPGSNANSSSGSTLSGISNAIGSIGMSARGIRGSSIDRGRGRARGGLYHSSLGNYQSRSGFVYDEEARGAAPRAERSWAERNGNSTAEAEWSAANCSSSSPRKDFSQLRSGPDVSWRRNRVDEDGQIPNGTHEGWRTSSSSVTHNSSYKWPVRSTSWRGGDGDANSSFNSDGGPPRLERSKSTQSGVGGTRETDGTGVPGMRRFVGMNANASWDEDNYPEWAMDEPIEGGGSFDATGAFLGNVDRITGEKLKYGDGLRSEKNQRQSTKCDEKSESITSNGANENDNSTTDTSETNNSIEDESKPNDESLIESSSPKEIKNGRDKQLSSNTYETDKERKPNEEQPTKPILDSNYTDNAIIAMNKQKSLTTDRMLEVAEDIEKLIMDDDQSCAESDDQLLPERVPKHVAVDEALTATDKLKEKDMSDLWYYRDPQGKIQGPFTATEMLEWYRAGYFDETLNVRRVCDPQFLELGGLLKTCSGPNAIPFISMPIMSPLRQNTAKVDINLSANAKLHPASPTKPLANLVHNQKILAPQPTPPTNTPGYYDMLQSQSFMNLMNAPPNDFLLSNSLPKHPSQNLANLPNALSKQAHLKNQQQTQSLQHLLSQHKKDFNAPDGSMANNVPIIHQDPVIRMLSSMNLPRQQNAANVLPVPTMPQPTTPQNNSFQSLMMQLHTMQKPHVLQQQIQQHHQQSIIMNAMNSSALPRNHNTLGVRNPIDEITQQQQQQPQMPHQTDARATHGLWDLPIPPRMQPNANAKLPVMHNNIVPSSSMKTELQIIEHLHAKVKQQDVSRLQFPQFAGINSIQSQMNHHHPQNEMQSQHPSSQQQAQHQQPHVVPSAMVLGNIPNDMILQQSDMFRTKNDNIKDIQLDANKQQQHTGIGKVAKNKTEPVTAGTTLKTFDANTIQANNKINNNLVGPTTDEPLQSDEIENINQLNKAKNAAASAAAAAADAAAMATNKPIEIKSQLKANNNAANDDAMMKKSINNNNSNNANATAPKNTTKESTKKKKEQKAAEEKRRLQEEEERQQLEERKRLELIAAQRKAKLVDQSPARVEPAPKRINLAPSVAPWSNITEKASVNATNTPLTLTEIQKAEREQRAELYRLEQAQQQNQALLDQQQHKESVLKWKLNPQNQAKSLAEIQAEESKARQQTTLLIAANQAQQNKQNAKKHDDKWPVSTWSMIWGNDQSGNNNNTTNPNVAIQSGNANANCFWEDSSKSLVVQSKLVAQQNGTASKPLVRSQTVSSMQSISNESKAKQAAPLTTSGSALAVNSIISTKSNAAAAVTVIANANHGNNNNSKKAKETTTKPKKKATNSEETSNDEFGTWCNNKLTAHVNVIDVPTFVSFLRDIESPFEVKDYIRMYLGETKECSEFAKNFLERRSKYKNQQRAANAHIDDMCSPAPAITPANESQDTKGKGKKEKKKNKMTKLDSRILGFSVTSAEDRLNVGARDYARDGP